MQRIVVGIDGSEGAQRALAFAISIARELKAEIVAVHAIDMPAYPVGPFGYPAPAPSNTSWRDEIADAMEDDWCAQLRGAGVPHRIIVEEGGPVDVIREQASREDATMIVVGARGRGGFKELLLGSVSHQLAHHATRPVVVVPHGDR